MLVRTAEPQVHPRECGWRSRDLARDQTRADYHNQ
jgi:hypothetical protein